MCHSVLSNGPFVKLLISQGYNYVGIKHVLRKCTGKAALAAGKLGAMERVNHIMSLSEFEFRIFESVD